MTLLKGPWECTCMIVYELIKYHTVIRSLEIPREYYNNAFSIKITNKNILKNTHKGKDYPLFVRDSFIKE